MISCTRPRIINCLIVCRTSSCPVMITIFPFVVAVILSIRLSKKAVAPMHVVAKQVWVPWVASTADTPLAVATLLQERGTTVAHRIVGAQPYAPLAAGTAL